MHQTLYLAHSPTLRMPALTRADSAIALVILAFAMIITLGCSISGLHYSGATINGPFAILSLLWIGGLYLRERWGLEKLGVFIGCIGALAAFGPH